MKQGHRFHGINPRALIGAVMLVLLALMLPARAQAGQSYTIYYVPLDYDMERDDFFLANWGDCEMTLRNKLGTIHFKPYVSLTVNIDDDAKLSDVVPALCRSGQLTPFAPKNFNGTKAR